jgi:capsular polysaccharide biosynthesis protein
MELIAIWHFLRRRWWLIVLPGLVALALTLPQLRNVIAPPVSYSVQVRLSAAAPPAPAEGVTTPYEDNAYVPWLASEYAVINLAQWITSDSFAQEVAQVLGEQDNDLADESLSSAFFADSYRSILVLYVSWDDSDEIRALAEAAITVLQTRNQDYFAQLAAEPAEVVPLDTIEVAQVAPPITTRLAPLVRIAIGFAAGLALAVLAEYLDRSLRTRAEVEALGLPVLAEIPREK